MGPASGPSGEHRQGSLHSHGSPCPVNGAGPWRFRSRCRCRTGADRLPRVAGADRYFVSTHWATREDATSETTVAELMTEPADLGNPKMHAVNERHGG